MGEQIEPQTVRPILEVEILRHGLGHTAQSNHAGAVHEDIDACEVTDECPGEGPDVVLVAEVRGVSACCCPAASHEVGNLVQRGQPTADQGEARPPSCKRDRNRLADPAPCPCHYRDVFCQCTHRSPRPASASKPCSTSNSAPYSTTSSGMPPLS